MLVNLQPRINTLLEQQVTFLQFLCDTFSNYEQQRHQTALVLHCQVILQRDWQYAQNCLAMLQNRVAFNSSFYYLRIRKLHKSYDSLYNKR
jgi:hypothetical protein